MVYSNSVSRPEICPSWDVEALAGYERPLHQRKGLIGGLYKPRFRINFTVLNLTLDSEFEALFLQQNGICPLLDAGSLTEGSFLDDVGQAVEVDGIRAATQRSAPFHRRNLAWSKAPEAHYTPTADIKQMTSQGFNKEELFGLAKEYATENGKKLVQEKMKKVVEGTKKKTRISFRQSRMLM